jgi:hypothetical protein
VVNLSPGEAPQTFWNLAEQAPIYRPTQYSIAVQ